MFDEGERSNSTVVRPICVNVLISKGLEDVLVKGTEKKVIRFPNNNCPSSNANS